jgi:preprotein translocase subunit SecE
MWRVAERLRAPFFWADLCATAKVRSGDVFVYTRRCECSKAMANPLQFLQEVRAEAAKVTWPSRRETMITSILVVVMVVFASLFFLGVDAALRVGVRFILSLGH